MRCGGGGSGAGDGDGDGGDGGGDGHDGSGGMIVVVHDVSHLNLGVKICLA